MSWTEFPGKFIKTSHNIHLELRQTETHWDIIVNGELKDHDPDLAQAKTKANDFIPYRMKTIAQNAQKALTGLLPFLTVSVDDNLMSSITIRGTKEKKEDWAYNIFHNAQYFIVSINPDKGRYYQEGQNVTLELNSKHEKLPKLRKYTGTPDKVIAKLLTWIKSLS